ncbi:FtsX-like permease family protein [Treponema sp.]|uniref:ABC transporter permease n=1 Tax=Treponema sp. TaxID=166 RepID=UPI0025CDCF01|nr:FtsX-like permease family protein [Treponema sp.]MCR5219126.1 ABC transporter permease [Treponema sp.]
MNLSSKLKWIYFISRRFSKIDSRGTSRLASLGICFGVLALVVIMSVMNGFQMTFIDAILEVSSYHVNVRNITDESEFSSWCSKDDRIKNVTSFYDAQGLLAVNSGQQCASLIRSIDIDAALKDKNFMKELNIISGSFNLDTPDSIVIGNSIARALGVNTGSKICIAAMSGSSDVSLLSQSRIFTVRGVFYSGYPELNSAYSFVNLEAGKNNFGKKALLNYGLKLKDISQVNSLIPSIKKAFPDSEVLPWTDFNRSFFGALRMEKNILLLMVLLIFLVVAINIHNGMKKLIYQRKSECALLEVFGAYQRELKSIFLLQGFITGFKGAVSGLALGLVITSNMSFVFRVMSRLQYLFEYFITWLSSPASLEYLSENTMFNVYARIPPRMEFGEIFLIFIFGVFSSVAASFLAGRKLLKVSVTEVLRDE